MNKSIIIFVFLLVLLISNVSGFNLEMDKNSYSSLEVATVKLQCTTGNEKNRAYNVTWTNGTNVIEIDSGITPSNCQSVIFFEQLSIPADSNWTNAKVNITGTNLAGEDFFNVTPISEGGISIINIEFSNNPRVNKPVGIKWEVIDSNNLKVSNARCEIHAEDSLGFHRETTSTITNIPIFTYDVMGVVGYPLTTLIFKENSQFAFEIHCICPINTSKDACFNTNRERLSQASATSEGVVNIGKWADVNTVTDKSNYTLADKQIKVCANITNNDTDRSRSYNIKYDFRCDGGNNQSLDRVLVDVHEEERVVEAGGTQTNCALLDINNIKTIQNKLSICYARTHVLVLDDDQSTVLIEYDTRSPNFNVTSDSNIETIGDNMLALVIGFGIVMLVFLVLAIVGLTNAHASPTLKHFGIFSISAMVLEMIIMFFVMYALDNGTSVTSILQINFLSALIIGFGLAMYMGWTISMKVFRPEGEEEERWVKDRW